MIYTVDVPFDTKTISKSALEAMIRSLEAEYCQVAIAIKMKEYNYNHLDLEGVQKEEDKKQMEVLDREVESGREAMEFHAKNINYFKNILATYD